MDDLYTLELSLPMIPIPLNQLLRMHHQVRRRINDDYKNMVKAHMKTLLRPSLPLEKATITIVRNYYRFVDWDNCVASYKGIIDILVKKEGILVDDSYFVTGPWNVTQEFRCKDDGPLSWIKIEGSSKARQRANKKK